MSNKAISKKQARQRKREKQSIFAGGSQSEKKQAGAPEMPASVSNIPLSQSSHEKPAISLAHGCDFPLPEPMALAKLAAILRPTLQPVAALKVAMQFYVEAVLFSQKQSSKTFEELFTEFGSEETQRAQRVAKVGQELKAIREDTLELDRAKDDDAARQYLAECGLRLKTARAVLASIRRYWNQLLRKEVTIYEHGKEGTINISWAYERRSVEDMIESCKRGKMTYELPKYLLESVSNYAKLRDKERKRKSWHTRKSRKKPPQKTVK